MIKSLYFVSLMSLFSLNAFAVEAQMYICNCALSGYEMPPLARSKEDPSKEFVFYAAKGTDVHAVCRSVYPHEERPANWTDGIGGPIQPGTKFYSTAFAVCR
ncbi:MAG: hypothetical protein ACXVCY_18800 [Pseudobdellovibrionaceae bacterium]